MSNDEFEAASLTDAALMQVLVPCTLDQAERLLTVVGGVRGLAQSDMLALARAEGLGQENALRLAAAVELGRRAAEIRSTERAIVRSAADAARFMEDMAALPQEHVRVLLLDNSGGLMTAVTVYIGTAYTAALRPAEVYRAPIVRGSAAIMLVHNHPGGSPNPSPEDFETTRALAAAGRLLGIPLLDHVIIGARGWSSMKELGFDL